MPKLLSQQPAARWLTSWWNAQPGRFRAWYGPLSEAARRTASDCKSEQKSPVSVLVVLFANNARLPGQGWLMQPPPASSVEKSEADVEKDKSEEMQEDCMFYNCSTAPWRLDPLTLSTRLPLTTNAIVDQIDIVRSRCYDPVLPRCEWVQTHVMLVRRPPPGLSYASMGRLITEMAIVAERTQCTHVCLPITDLLSTPTAPSSSSSSPTTWLVQHLFLNTPTTLRIVLSSCDANCLSQVGLAFVDLHASRMSNGGGMSRGDSYSRPVTVQYPVSAAASAAASKSSSVVRNRSA